MSTGAVIIETGTTTAQNRDQVHVRYDEQSQTAAEGDAAWVKATQGQNVVLKKRTVFSVRWAKLNFTLDFDAFDQLRLPGYVGTHNQRAGLVWPPEDNAVYPCAKMEATLFFDPMDIDWDARGNPFPPEGSDNGLFRLWREATRTSVGQGLNDANRSVFDNDADWVTDGRSIAGDNAQYPITKQLDPNKPTSPNVAFRIDAPNPGGVGKQFAQRGDFRELAQWAENETGRYVRICPYAYWHANLTGLLPDGRKGGENSHGADIPAADIPNNKPTANAGPDQTVAVGAVVTLDGSGSTDSDNDELSYAWTPPAGITLSSNTVAKPTFTATNAGDYTFTLRVTDKMSALHHHNPGNSQSDPATVVIHVR